MTFARARHFDLVRGRGGLDLVVVVWKNDFCLIFSLGQSSAKTAFFMFSQNYIINLSASTFLAFLRSFNTFIIFPTPPDQRIVLQSFLNFL